MNSARITIYSLILSLIVPVLSYAQYSQRGTLALRYQLPNRVPGLTQGQIDKLELKVTRIINKHGMAAFNNNAALIILPSLNIYETSTVEGTRILYIVDTEFDLSIGQEDRTFFATYNKSIRGSGRSEQAAINNAINKIPVTDPGLEDFFSQARGKIISYYEQDCDNVFRKAENFANINDYTSAIKLLWTVPSLAENCYSLTSNRIREYYRRKEDLNCKRFLNIAEVALATKDYNGARNALFNINPESECYPASQDLKKQMREQVGEDVDKAWEYKLKRLENSSEVEKAKYDAVGSIGAAAVISSTREETGASNRGGNSVVINNNAGAGTISQSQSPNEINEENVFSSIRVVSPASRGITGEIISTEDPITIHGFIDPPGNVKSLTIDGDQASWDDDGVFSKKVALPKEENKVQIQIETKTGEKDNKTLVIKKLKEKVGEKPPKSTKDMKKFALVIGNNDYKAEAKLQNARNDAVDMANALQAIGFSVTQLLDATYEQMRAEVLKFNNKIEDSDIAFFYYSGHGLEIDGENYLVPINAVIKSRDDIKLQCLQAQDVVNAMDVLNTTSLNVVVLDACRSNPFPKGTRGGDGLARITPPSGMLVAYSTEPGKVASDGVENNGLYTGELIKQIKIPQRIEDVFINTRNEVEQKSNGEQRPWEEARLKGVYYLKYPN